MIRATAVLSKIRASFWFVPSVMVFSSIVGAVVMTEVDARVSRDLLIRWPRLFGAGAEGSRAMLSAIAGSMITVATVTFSITMLALSQTSTQYSPRMLRNFMSDRATQVVLGVFVGVFAYCLVILRTISGGEEDAFVPALSVTAGGAFALAAIGFLVFFIHRMASSLQGSTIIAAVGEETLRVIDHLFPDTLEKDDHTASDSTPNRTNEDQDVVPIPAPETGYVESIDGDELLREALLHSTVIRIDSRVGDFVIESNPIGCARLADGWTEKSARRLGGAFVISRHRSIWQDPGFGIQQLVDVAVKALSPGINDPTTAIMSIEYITAIVERLAERRIEPQRLRDTDGAVRVEIPVPTFPEFSEACFGPIRAAASDATVLRKLALSIGRAGSTTRSRERRQHLMRLLEQVTRSSAAIAEPDDKVSVDRAVRNAQLSLSAGTTFQST